MGSKKRRGIIVALKRWKKGFLRHKKNKRAEDMKKHEKDCIFRQNNYYKLNKYVNGKNNF